MTIMETQPKPKVGLFPIHYQIGMSEPGAVLFTLSLLVDSVREQVSGVGRVTQATHPSLDVTTRLDGDYTSMKGDQILVTATGYPPISWPIGGGVGPVILPNVQLRMILNHDWTSGSANYKYRTDESTWKSITDAPVKEVQQTDKDTRKSITDVPGKEAQPESQAGKTIELGPEQVNASYQNGTLMISVSGHEDGVKDIRIIPRNIYSPSPVFEVVGGPSPAIGDFPYKVEGHFHLPEKPASISFVTPQGIKEFPVKQL